MNAFSRESFTTREYPIGVACGVEDGGRIRECHLSRVSSGYRGSSTITALYLRHGPCILQLSLEIATLYALLERFCIGMEGRTTGSRR